MCLTGCISWAFWAPNQITSPSSFIRELSIDHIIGGHPIPRESHPLALKYFKLLIFSFVFSLSFSLNYLFGNILHALFHLTWCACLKQFGKKCQLLRIAGGTFSFVKGLWDSVSPHRPFLSTILDFPIRHMNVRLSWPYNSSWQFSNPRADTIF